MYQTISDKDLEEYFRQEFCRCIFVRPDANGKGALKNSGLTGMVNTRAKASIEKALAGCLVSTSSASYVVAIAPACWVRLNRKR
jgi:hypothetical protein